MAQSPSPNVDVPNQSDDAREIWLFVRSWFTIIRVILVIAIILVAEIFEDNSLYNLSLSVWAIIVGFPLFLIISLMIIQGDKKFAPDLDEKRLKRIKD